MRIVPLEEIQRTVTFDAAIDAVRDAFIAFDAGHITQPDPMQILFERDDGSFFGDCHVKAAQRADGPYFAVKLAAGFYDNPRQGLPANSGLLLVMSSTTGRPVALLQDDGWLTQLRTAAAATLAAMLAPLDATSRVGVIGTGIQSRLNARMLCAQLGVDEVLVHGRSEAGTSAFSDALAEHAVRSEPVADVETLCDRCDVVITATPSTTPVIRLEDLTGSLHIVALGCDSPGKLEIDPAVLAAADLVVTDSHDQCLHHGDFGAAVRAGAIAEDADLGLGAVLAGHHQAADFAAASLSVVDLTGLGAQDLAVASLVVDAM